jgi:hypothetical protein
MSDVHGTLFYITSDVRLREMIQQGQKSGALKFIVYFFCENPGCLFDLMNPFLAFSGKVLYLRPDDIGSIGIAEYGKMDDIMKRGYDVAKRMLPKFRSYRLKLAEEAANPESKNMRSTHF